MQFLFISFLELFFLKKFFIHKHISKGNWRWVEHFLHRVSISYPTMSQAMTRFYMHSYFSHWNALHFINWQGKKTATIRCLLNVAEATELRNLYLFMNKLLKKKRLYDSCHNLTIYGDLWEQIIGVVPEHISSECVGCPLHTAV